MQTEAPVRGWRQKQKYIILHIQDLSNLTSFQSRICFVPLILIHELMSLYVCYFVSLLCSTLIGSHAVVKCAL